MSQHSENDSDDDDCEYFLQPVSNQYNISDKIKEANQQLYRSEHPQRSQPKVRFRDHQLVDYEPEDGMEIIERRRSSTSFPGHGAKVASHNNSNNNNNNNNDDIDETPSDIDDGYIDDEVLETSGDERLIIETIEIEEVCEEIEVLDISDNKFVHNNNNNDGVRHETSGVDSEEAKYEEEEFCKDDDIGDARKSTKRTTSSKMTRDKSSSSSSSTSSGNKKFRSKINPIGNVPVDERKPRNKKCCEYKETDEYKQKLPKYNGFYSHYGLSKDEIERRECKMLTNVEVHRRRSSQYTEKQEHLAKTNEEAFAKWLQKKMCDPMRRSNPINMYDLKPNFRRKQQFNRMPQRKQRQVIQRQMETEEQEDEESKSDQEEEEEDEEEEMESNEIFVPEPSDENGSEEQEPEEEETERSDS